MFLSKVRAYPSELGFGCSTEDKDGQIYPTNTLAYYENLYLKEMNSFKKLAPGPNVIKHFTSVISKRS